MRDSDRSRSERKYEQLSFCIVSNTPQKGIRKLGIYNIGKTSPPPNQKHHLNASARPPVLSARPPGFNVAGRKRRALVGLATADSIPDAGESDASHEDDGSVVHRLDSNGNGGRHGEEGDGKADPGWEVEMLADFWTCGSFFCLL